MFVCRLLIALGVLSVSSVGAMAADLPMKAPALVPSPAYNWTGFYIGANAGYGWKDPTVTFTPNDAAALAFTCGGAFGGTCAPPTSFNIGGGFGGLQIGYNWQFSPNWLLGVEADFDWSHIDGTGISNFFLGGFPRAASIFTASQNIKWFGTVRARLGYLPVDKLLVYVTGGFAFAHIDENIALNSRAGANGTTSGPGGNFGFRCVAGPNCFLGSSSRTATGWTVGGGVEYVVWNNLSIKAEYLYVNLGGGDSVNVVAQNTSGQIPASFTAAFSSAAFNTVRVGLNWKF